MRIQLNKTGLAPKKAGDLPSQYVAHFCKKCGAELFGRWYEIISNISREEITGILCLQKCPVCGSELVFENGYVFVSNPMGGYNGADSIYNPVVRKVVNDNNLISSAPVHSFSWQLWGDYIHEDLDTIFALMADRRKDSEAASAYDAVQELIHKYENAALDSGGNTVRIESPPNKVKEYLRNLLRIETDIYALTEWLEELYYHQIVVNRLAYGSKYIAKAIAEQQLKETRERYYQQEFALKELKSKGPERVSIPKLNKPQKPTPPVLETPGFFNKKKVMAQNAILTSQYEAQLTEYTLSIAEYEKKLLERDEKIKRLTKVNEESHAASVAAITLRMTEAKEALDQAVSRVKDCQASSVEIVTPEQAKKELIDSQIVDAENMLLQLIKCKYELYSYNIIFAKYRNPVALATFYEYLESGRCSALEGTNGAYNLYEAEIRADRIIARLDDVVDALGDIKENQYMIYSELSAANRKLDALKSSMRTAVDSIGRIEANTEKMNVYMEKVAANSDVIAHNTAVNAYYSQVNAELTDALGYMTAMR